MPRVCRLSNVTLYVYADDHAPPHFHAVGPDGEAQIRIDNLQIMRGRISRAAYGEVVAWASLSENTATLQAEWSRLNDRE